MPIPLPLFSSTTHCPPCGFEFQAAVFDSPPPVRAEVQAALSGGAPCARHARNAAVASCDRCGGFMCGLCRIDSDGRSLCAVCFDRLRADGALDSARTTFRSWRSLAVPLAWLSLFMWVLWPLLGPLGLHASIQALKQSSKDGDEGGRWPLYLSTLVSSLVTVGGVVGLAFFVLSIAGKR